MPPPTAIRDELGRLTDAAGAPKITTDELDELLADAARPDATGRKPEDDDWEPTYNLNAAAGAGWRLKASRCATSSSSSSLDGERDPDTYRYLNCVRQAEHYEKLARPTVGTSRIRSSMEGFGA